MGQASLPFFPTTRIKRKQSSIRISKGSLLLIDKGFLLIYLDFLELKKLLLCLQLFILGFIHLVQASYSRVLEVSKERKTWTCLLYGCGRGYCGIVIILSDKRIRDGCWSWTSRVGSWVYQLDHRLRGTGCRHCLVEWGSILNGADTSVHFSQMNIGVSFDILTTNRTAHSQSSSDHRYFFALLNQSLHG